MDLSWNGEEEFKSEIERNGGITLSADIRDDASIGRAFEETISTFGTVDVLVNNAGLRQRDMVPWMYVKVLDLDLEKIGADMDLGIRSHQRAPI